MNVCTDVAPRAMTERNPDRVTDGHLGAEVAEKHGRPWIPWQRAAADLLGEMTPDGRYAYPIAVVLVPRQCGKTMFAFDLMMGRARAYRDYRVAYCAQTGHVTTERFTERMGELPERWEAHTRRSAGTERITFPGTGSYLKAFPPRDGALRGSALDLVFVDEPQEIDEDKGRALDQTILPTFTTRPRRQFILIGTAGTDRSTWLARYLKAAQEGAPGVALVTYGAGDDEDQADPRVWRRRHPGLAAGLTDEAVLQSARSVMGPSGFAREYLNVWQAYSLDRIIPATSWARIRSPKSRPKAGVAPILGAAVALDRSAAAIVACWPDEDDMPTLEVVDHREGADWVAPRLLELARHGTIWADSQGPVLTVVDDVRRLAAQTRSAAILEQTDTPDWSAACAGMLDRILKRQVQHRGDASLDIAVTAVNRREIGDGGWAWGRRVSTTDISPLEAATVALWGHLHRPQEKRRPRAA